MRTLDLRDSCPNCLVHSRRPAPLTPLFVELTSGGYRADYLCRVCLHGWYAMWNPDALGAAETPERAA